MNYNKNRPLDVGIIFSIKYKKYRPHEVGIFIVIHFFWEKFRPPEVGIWFSRFILHKNRLLVNTDLHLRSEIFRSVFTVFLVVLSPNN